MSIDGSHECQCGYVCQGRTTAQEREAKLREEIERLENDLAATRILYDADNKDNAINGALKDVAHFEAENAKLRAELEYYKDSTILQVKLKAAVELERDKLRGVVLRQTKAIEKACNDLGGPEASKVANELGWCLAESADALGGGK